MASEATAIPAADITLGLIAGGRATRLGGLDKAWLSRNGVSQVLRWRDTFRSQTAALLVNAHRDLQRYDEHGITTVSDRHPEIGPLAGLDTLAHACRTPWLFTLPVDVVDIDTGLLLALQSARAQDGAHAADDDGVQPLVALWRTESLREAAAHAIAAGSFAVHQLQARLDMACVRLEGVRFGNLNTPADLGAAGIDPET